ncbi:MAG: hypothetical protein Q4D57_05400 [Clostridia bacterium]|nr:hypothetical protein [Clostridia bacterium]
MKLSVSSTKVLVEKGIAGYLRDMDNTKEGFPNKLAVYNWMATRDFNLVLIFLAMCNYAVTKSQQTGKGDVLNELKAHVSQLNNTFTCMVNFKNNKYQVDTNNLPTQLNKILDPILNTIYDGFTYNSKTKKVEEDPNDERKKRIIANLKNEIPKRMKNITNWVINGPDVGGAFLYICEKLWKVTLPPEVREKIGAATNGGKEPKFKNELFSRLLEYQNTGFTLHIPSEEPERSMAIGEQNLNKFLISSRKVEETKEFLEYLEQRVISGGEKYKHIDKVLLDWYEKYGVPDGFVSKFKKGPDTSTPVPGPAEVKTSNKVWWPKSLGDNPSSDDIDAYKLLFKNGHDKLFGTLVKVGEDEAYVPNTVKLKTNLEKVTSDDTKNKLDSIIKALIAVGSEWKMVEINEQIETTGDPIGKDQWVMALKLRNSKYNSVSSSAFVPAPAPGTQGGTIPSPAPAEESKTRKVWWPGRLGEPSADDIRIYKSLCATETPNILKGNKVKINSETAAVPFFDTIEENFNKLTSIEDKYTAARILRGLSESSWESISLGKDINLTEELAVYARVQAALQRNWTDKRILGVWWPSTNPTAPIPVADREKYKALFREFGSGSGHLKCEQLGATLCLPDTENLKSDIGNLLRDGFNNWILRALADDETFWRRTWILIEDINNVKRKSNVDKDDWVSRMKKLLEDHDKSKSQSPKAPAPAPADTKKSKVWWPKSLSDKPSDSDIAIYKSLFAASGSAGELKGNLVKRDAKEAFLPNAFLKKEEFEGLPHKDRLEKIIGALVKDGAEWIAVEIDAEIEKLRDATYTQWVSKVKADMHKDLSKLANESKLSAKVYEWYGKKQKRNPLYLFLESIPQLKSMLTHPAYGENGDVIWDKTLYETLNKEFLKKYKDEKADAATQEKILYTLRSQVYGIIAFDKMQDLSQRWEALPGPNDKLADALYNIVGRGKLEGIELKFKEEIEKTAIESVTDAFIATIKKVMPSMMQYTDLRKELRGYLLLIEQEIAETDTEKFGQMYILETIFEKYGWKLVGNGVNPQYFRFVHGEVADITGQTYPKFLDKYVRK